VNYNFTKVIFLINTTVRALSTSYENEETLKGSNTESYIKGKRTTYKTLDTSLKVEAEAVEQIKSAQKTKQRMELKAALETDLNLKLNTLAIANINAPAALESSQAGASTAKAE
jgi:hypothetical protein